MKLLILNSGLGHRMGDLTKDHPKCMTEIGGETILSRQLKCAVKNNIRDVVITTGYYDKVLIEYCRFLNLPINIEFVKNPIYDKTNYIYSIYCVKDFLNDDILFMHGDLVFDDGVFKRVIESLHSCMTVDCNAILPEKDFKAVIEGDKIIKVGIEFFENAVSAQPLYKLVKKDWFKWLNKIVEYCERGETNCYAEKALNEIARDCNIIPLDTSGSLCREVDTPNDLYEVMKCLNK